MGAFEEWIQGLQPGDEILFPGRNGFHYPGQVLRVFDQGRKVRVAFNRPGREPGKKTIAADRLSHRDFWAKVEDDDLMHPENDPDDCTLCNMSGRDPASDDPCPDCGGWGYA